MSQKTASIIIPCYNVEKYLPRCLDSLLEQTFDDFEIICVNDGSIDKTLQILRVYEQKYPDRFIIIDKQNEGAWRARLNAIEVANGKYIGSVDGDDYVAPDYLEKLYRTVEENDADIAICGFYRIDGKSERIVSTEMTEARKAFDAKVEPARLLELNGAIWNKLFKTEMLRSVACLKESPLVFEDMMLQLLVFPHVAKVAFCSEPLVNYIVHDNSLMTTIDKSKIGSTYKAMLEVKDVYLKEASGKLLYFLDAAAFLHLGLSLMFRVSYDKTADLPAELNYNRAYLDENFPTWNSNQIISARNARKYKGALRKTYYGRIIYNSGLMPLALQAYRAMINAGRDIKW